MPRYGSPPNLQYNRATTLLEAGELWPCRRSRPTVSLIPVKTSRGWTARKVAGTPRKNSWIHPILCHQRVVKRAYFAREINTFRSRASRNESRIDASSSENEVISQDSIFNLQFWASCDFQHDYYSRDKLGIEAFFSSFRRFFISLGVKKKVWQ